MEWYQWRTADVCGLTSWPRVRDAAIELVHDLPEGVPGTVLPDSEAAEEGST